MLINEYCGVVRDNDIFTDNDNFAQRDIFVSHDAIISNIQIIKTTEYKPYKLPEKFITYIHSNVILWKRDCNKFYKINPTPLGREVITNHNNIAVLEIQFDSLLVEVNFNELNEKHKFFNYYELVNDKTKELYPLKNEHFCYISRHRISYYRYKTVEHLLIVDVCNKFRVNGNYYFYVNQESQNDKLPPIWW